MKNIDVNFTADNNVEAAKDFKEVVIIGECLEDDKTKVICVETKRICQ
jgi:hypothetical protein